MCHTAACKRSNDVCAKILDDRLLNAGSKNAGSGRTKALCRIGLWQSEVDERLNDPVGAHGERDAGNVGFPERCRSSCWVIHHLESLEIKLRDLAGEFFDVDGVVFGRGVCLMVVDRSAITTLDRGAIHDLPGDRPQLDNCRSERKPHNADLQRQSRSFVVVSIPDAVAPHL